MARPAMLSNGQLMVGLNEHGLINDFYYPFVGLENLTTSRSVHHKIGVWVDGAFSWVDDGSWNSEVKLENDALISNCSLINHELGINIETVDFVDPLRNGFIRRIKVTNICNNQRLVKLFMHQVFEISRGGRGDTAMFVPDENYILDYKGRCSLLCYGLNKETNAEFDQFCVGNYGIEGKEGTFKDAEDGELEGNAVEHGGVDSVVRFSLDLEANATGQVDYWLVAAASQYQCETINADYKKLGIDKIESSTRDWWHNWLSIGANKLHSVNPSYLNAVKKSMMTIKAHTDKRGGILASGDSSIFNYGRDYYCYCWPRDGAYAVWPLIRLGYTEEPKKFFEFCRDTLSHEGFLMHKYQPDRAIGSTWHPLIHNNRKELAIQEDETASVINMLGEYLKYSNDEEFVSSLYNTLIQPAANFMSKFIDEQTNLPHASYDLWEEKFASHTYTAALVCGALNTASDIARKLNYPDDEVRWKNAAERIKSGFELYYDHERQAYRKSLILMPDDNLNFDSTIDISSLYGVVMYTDEKLTTDNIVNTLSAIEQNISNLTSLGGVVRYENDWYMRNDENLPPNPWFVCTLWLAQIYIAMDMADKALPLMDWSLSHTLSGGIMSEQVHPLSGQPVGVAPLVWSHAELINTALDLVAYQHKSATKELFS